MAQNALRVDFRTRVGLGTHATERKDEVVQVRMIVELLSSMPIKEALGFDFLYRTRPTLCNGIQGVLNIETNIV